MHSRATPAVYLFQWDTNVWDTWPQVEGHNFTEDWNKEGHFNHPKRLTSLLTTEDHRRLQRATPAHNKLLAPINDFMRRQFANQNPSRTNMLILVLGHRMAPSNSNCLS